MTPDEIIRAVRPHFEITAAQANVIANQIYKKRISDFSKIPGIPKKLKEILSEIFSTGIFKPAGMIESSDGSIKYLFRNENGLEFETVFIPEKKRTTVCVSTQSGCRMGCPFCATGIYGFRGNLKAGEIINQVISLPEAGRVNHIVFMGMGEPMDNLENVLKACEIFTAEWGVTISQGNITISTIGIKPGVVEFLEKSGCNLTLSLFSPFSEERKRIISVERTYPAAGIIDMMKTFPAKKKRRFSIAYMMINNVNDTDRHLRELKDMFRDSRIRINLLPYHPLTEDLNIPSSPGRMQHFKHELVISGISASIRKSRGADVFAACGLLASGIKRRN